jgi:hypothetical protein
MKSYRKVTAGLEICFGLLLMAVIALPAHANRRRFSYTYESAVLPKDAREIEIWNTVRLNKKNFYRRLDQRVEYEWGLGGGVQTAFYLNHTAKAAQTTVGDPTNPLLTEEVIETENEMSFSNEWKFKLFDAYADPLGLGLYAEWTVAPTELELEGKLLLDKSLSEDLFLAFNTVYEMEFESELEDGEVETESEAKLEFDLGLSYDLGAGFGIGLEARHHSVMFEVDDENGGERDATFSAIFLGPTLSYAGTNWWLTATFMPQITGKADESTDKLDVIEHEKAEARLLFSFEL